MKKLAIVGKTQCKFEDGGHAMILEINNGEEVFIRLQSWDENNLPEIDKHTRLKPFFDKRLLITVEVVD